jgi:superfamily II RNA helicase
LVKRGDDGMEPLTTSALLQMAGRAGRRGKDAAGTVVVARGRKFGDRDAGLARRVLLSDVLPIASKFAPSYGVACALLRGGDLARCRAVVERSFGSFLANRKVTPPEEPLCGGLAEGVLRDYTVLLAAAGDACDAFEAARALDDDRALEDARRALRAAQGAVLASPVSQLAPDKQLEALEAYGALRAANEAPRPPAELPAPDAPRAPSPAWRRFETLVDVLERFGAVEDGAPTALGDLVASVNGDNELLLATCLLDDATLDVATGGSPAEVAALFSAFVCEIGDRRGVFVDYGPSAKVRDATDALFERAVLPLSDLQFEAGLGDVGCRLDDSAAGLVESWADGAAWAQVKDATSLDHGDLIRLFRRTLDVLKTAANLDPALAPPSFAAVRSAARAAAKAVDRPPVRDDQFDAIFVRDDDGGDGEDDPKDP